MQRGTGGLAQTHSHPGTSGWLVSTTFQPLYPGKDPVAMEHKAGWAWASLDGTESLTSTGIRSLVCPAYGKFLYWQRCSSRHALCSQEVKHEYSEVCVIHNYCVLHSHVASLSVRGIRRLNKPVYLLDHVSRSCGWWVSVSWNLFLLLSLAPNYLLLLMCKQGISYIHIV
jgi:hypothetical protein